MNLDVYRNFVKIIECGTISGASKELFIPQPSLSNQLKALEANYGTELVIRGARKISLTSAGEILYGKAKRICLIEDMAQKEIKASIEGVKGTLHLGITPVSPDPMTEDLLLDFSEKYPDVDFDIKEANTPQLLEWVEQGKLEIAIVRNHFKMPPQFVTGHFREEHIMVAFHKKNPWLSPKIDTVPVSALEGIPLCLSKGYLKRITDDCLEAGFEPIIHSVSFSRQMALMWAKRGTAVAIFVQPLQGPREVGPICYRPLLGMDMDTRRSVVYLKSRGLSAVAKSFIDFIKVAEPLHQVDFVQKE